MSTKPNDGGPAFPVMEYTYSASGDIRPEPTIQIGMSLRAWLAGMALQSTIATGVEGSIGDAAKRLGIPTEKYKAEMHWPKLCAKEAVAFADALIEELEKEAK